MTGILINNIDSILIVSGGTLLSGVLNLTRREDLWRIAMALAGEEAIRKLVIPIVFDQFGPLNLDQFLAPEQQIYVKPNQATADTVSGVVINDVLNKNAVAEAVLFDVVEQQKAESGVQTSDEIKQSLNVQQQIYNRRRRGLF